MRENSQAGAFPQWRGSDAYPVRFPATSIDSMRHYGPNHGPRRHEDTKHGHEGTKARRNYWPLPQTPLKSPRRKTGRGMGPLLGCRTEQIVAALSRPMPRVRRAAKGREVQVARVGPVTKLSKEI